MPCPWPIQTTSRNHFPFIWIIFNKIHILFVVALPTIRYVLQFPPSSIQFLSLSGELTLLHPPNARLLSFDCHFLSGCLYSLSSPCVCVCLCMCLNDWMYLNTSRLICVRFLTLIPWLIFFWLPGQYGRWIGIDHKFDRISEPKNCSAFCLTFIWNRNRLFSTRGYIIKSTQQQYQTNTTNRKTAREIKLNTPYFSLESMNVKKEKKWKAVNLIMRR